MKKQPEKVKKSRNFTLVTLLPKVNHCVKIGISVMANVPLTKSDEEKLKRLPKKSASLLEKVGKIKPISWISACPCLEPGLALLLIDEFKYNSNAAELVLKEFRDITKINISDVRITTMSRVPIFIWTPVEQCRSI